MKSIVKLYNQLKITYKLTFETYSVIWTNWREDLAWS